jgi:hypothetical protein
VVRSVISANVCLRCTFILFDSACDKLANFSLLQNVTASVVVATFCVGFVFTTGKLSEWSTTKQLQINQMRFTTTLSNPVLQRQVRFILQITEVAVNGPGI